MSKGTDESSSQSDGAEDRFLDGSISKPVSTRFHVSKSELSSQVLNNRLNQSQWRKPIEFETVLQNLTSLPCVTPKVRFSILGCRAQAAVCVPVVCEPKRDNSFTALFTPFPAVREGPLDSTWIPARLEFVPRH